MLNRSEKLRLILYLGELCSIPEYRPNDDFCHLAEAAGLEALLYYQTRGRLPDVRGVFRERYRQQSACQLRNEFQLQKLYTILEKEQLPFVPIKGADLAFRIYPNPAMRPFGDFDIWVRSSDLKRFCEILEKSGWRCDLDCYSDHHAGMRHKDGCVLEPHFHLPNFQSVSSERLWGETKSFPGWKYRRCLSDELNLIMLFLHNAIDSYQMSNPLKLLLDTEYLLKSTPLNWSKVTTLCMEYHVPHPGVLLSAFPEFFASCHSCDIVFPPEVIEAVRKLLFPLQMQQYDRGYLNCKQAHPLHYSWWKAQLMHLSSENLKWKYSSLGDSKIQLYLYRWWDIVKKLSLLLRYFAACSDAHVEIHVKQQKLVEESWKSCRNDPCKQYDGLSCSMSLPYCPKTQKKFSLK